MVMELEPGLPLPAEFYRQDTRTVARALLGQTLVRRLPSGEALSGRIVETEAYLWDDPACHAFRGETPRCRTMFGPAGRAYVYFTYGLHTMLNVACAPVGVGEAVLIRAIEPLSGLEAMQRLRGDRVLPRSLTNGPGKLAQALGLAHLRDDGLDMTDPASALKIVAGSGAAWEIVAATRIGISQAADRLWRYYIKGNAWVSRREKALFQPD